MEMLSLRLHIFLLMDDVRTLTIGQKVDCKKAENWDISKVELVTDNGTSTVKPGEFNVAQDATVKVYYEPVTVNFAGAPTFYDYTVKAGSNYSINQPSNYGKNKDSNTKLTMGEAKQNYSEYQYNWLKDSLSVNTWTGSAAVIKGLLKGLDADGNVDMDASRRVEVKFRLKDDEMIDELNKIMSGTTDETETETETQAAE